MGNYSSGFIIILLSAPVWAQAACADRQPDKLPTLAQAEDDGYRPLTDKGGAATVDGNYSRTPPRSSGRWRPVQQDRDCKQQPAAPSEDDGYRPLTGYGNRPAAQPLPASQGDRYREAPVMPASPGNVWSEGAYPYHTDPPIVPGYGVMPYSFGGNGSVP